MKHFVYTVLIAAMACSFANAAETEKDTIMYSPVMVRHAGPFVVKNPVVLDSVNNAQKKFSDVRLIDTPLSVSAADNAAAVGLQSVSFEKGSLNVISFNVNAAKYISSDITVEGAKEKKIYVDEKELNGAASLQPGCHKVTVKLIPDTTAVIITMTQGSSLRAMDGKRAFTMTENLGTRYVYGAELSPSGRWALVTYSWYDARNEYKSERLLVDTKTHQASNLGRSYEWMPRSDRYYYTETESGKTNLFVVDPLTGSTKILAKDLPQKSFVMSPMEDYLVYTKYEDGPAKEDGVYEIVHPDDRQPGWRNRGNLMRYDLASGLVQQLTYSYHSTWVSDISSDGKHLLFAISTDTITQRPTSRSTFYDLNMETLETRMVIDKDAFIGDAIYAGEGADRILVKASAEAFGSIGNRVPEGMTPSMYDYHLYLLNVGNEIKVTPLTADDNTSIEGIRYNNADGYAYYTAQRADSVLLYRLDLKTLKSTQVAQPLEVLHDFCIARHSGEISVTGSGACVPYKSYKLSLAQLKKNVAPRNGWESMLIANPNEEFYADVEFGTIHPWSFKCKRGYDVTGHYYLPANFDKDKKYPVIVHYYGGCSPTSRRFGGGSHYPAHYWNALGYIVFVVNPSGASGFGQEWAARHVNTMGEGVAEDIIEATEQFAKDLPQVDAEHIGCVSASYGGFMTQCMLSKTDLFACGISHAGISDHTSYWGEGYWGYTYSQVSAANSYPWTRKDLFVDRSPLFNADKIHKPILFTHGTADTNVPIGESIQMYTALKLLGVPTAFVMVEGENHGIMDPTKRTKWINTMVAWFEKYLKNDGAWWDAIYTPKKL